MSLELMLQVCVLVNLAFDGKRLQDLNFPQTLASVYRTICHVSGYSKQRNVSALPSSYRLLEYLTIINNTPTYTWMKYLYTYIRSQRDL